MQSYLGLPIRISPRLLMFGPEVDGRVRGTRCPAFAERWHVMAAAAERHDFTLLQLCTPGLHSRRVLHDSSSAGSLFWNK